MVEIADKELEQAASKGMDDFLELFIAAYLKKIDNELTADNMHKLTGDQHVLLSYSIFRKELLEGGFCQLIQNGYGGYIFDNPFAKAMRLWGAGDFAKLLYKAKEIFDKNREDLEKERTEEEFMAMYETYEVFDELEESFFEEEELISTIIASYVDEHIELFAKIV